MIPRRSSITHSVVFLILLASFIGSVGCRLAAKKEPLPVPSYLQDDVSYVPPERELRLLRERDRLDRLRENPERFDQDFPGG